jgi:hypothetical protein
MIDAAWGSHKVTGVNTPRRAKEDWPVAAKVAADMDGSENKAPRNNDCHSVG